jgi:hypothetical protein
MRTLLCRYRWDTAKKGLTSDDNARAVPEKKKVATSVATAIAGDACKTFAAEPTDRSYCTDLQSSLQMAACLMLIKMRNSGVDGHSLLAGQRKLRSALRSSCSVGPWLGGFVGAAR